MKHNWMYSYRFPWPNWWIDLPGRYRWFRKSKMPLNTRIIYLFNINHLFGYPNIRNWL